MRGDRQNYTRSPCRPVTHLFSRNWRPITLLNVDYKLASRVLAGRLLKVIHVVVSKYQTCGVPGRDIVDYTSFSNVPAAVLSLDQEKAFDRVDWSFMLVTLSRMGLMSMVICLLFLSFFCPFSWCSPRLSSVSLVVCAGFGSSCC